MIVVFLLTLSTFAIVGIAASRVAKPSNKDYLLAGQSVPPWLVALSAVATNNSGYMFTGMIGATFIEGISVIWMMIGWITGDLLASLVVHKRLRQKAEQRKALGFGELLGAWSGKRQRIVEIIAGLVTIAFLVSYAGAQFSAGAKALHVLLGWDFSAGALIGAGIVVLYCWAGGIRASIWTDAAQSFVMIFSMTLLLVMGLIKVGGISGFADGIANVGGTYASLFPPSVGRSFSAVALFLLGWLFAGIGIIGQPHIMVRFLTLDQSGQMGRVRFYYYSWFTAFYGITIGVGLLARLLITNKTGFDPELVLPMLSHDLLGGALTGLVLAGLFAATMSTADSQIISCTAALTRDLTPKRTLGYWTTKGITLFVAACALLIALFGSRSVFKLVLMSWSGLASTFGPLLIVLSLGGRPNQWTAPLMMVCGLVTAIVWQTAGWGSYVYEILPGMLAGFLVFGLGHFFGWLAAVYRSATASAADKPNSKI